MVFAVSQRNTGFVRHPADTNDTTCSGVGVHGRYRAVILAARHLDAGIHLIVAAAQRSRRKNALEAVYDYAQNAACIRTCRLHIAMIHAVDDTCCAVQQLRAFTRCCGKGAGNSTAVYPGTTGNRSVVDAILNASVIQQIADKGRTRFTLALDGQVLHRTGQQVHQRGTGKAHRQSVALTVDLARECFITLIALNVDILVVDIFAQTLPVKAGDVDIIGQHSLGVIVALLVHIVLEPQHISGGLQRDSAAVVAGSHRHLCGGGSIVGSSRLGASVRRHQIIGARLIKGIGIGAIAGNVSHLIPVLVIDGYVQTADGFQLRRFAVFRRAGARLEGRGSDRITLRNIISILTELVEAAILIKVPVGEHGHIQPVAVGQQDIVAGAAPALAHQGVLMVTEVHQVFIVAPELLHVQAGGRAGGIQCWSAVIGQSAIHIQHIGFFLIVQNARGAPAALVGGQTHVVPLNNVDIGVEGGGALDDRIVVVAAPAEFRAVTVILAQTVVVQIKIGNGHVQIRQNGAILAHQGNTVIGNGDVDGHAVGGRFVVHRSNSGGEVGGEFLIRLGNGDPGGLTVRAGKLVARLVGHIVQLVPVLGGGGDCPRAGSRTVVSQKCCCYRALVCTIRRDHRRECLALIQCVKIGGQNNSLPAPGIFAVFASKG